MRSAWEPLVASCVYPSSKKHLSFINSTGLNWHHSQIANGITEVVSVISIKELLSHMLKSKWVISLLLNSPWASAGDTTLWIGVHPAHHLYFYAFLKTFFFSVLPAPPSLTANSPCCLSMKETHFLQTPRCLANTPPEVFLFLCFGVNSRVYFSLPAIPPYNHSLKAEAVSLSPLCSSQQPAAPGCLRGWPN